METKEGKISYSAIYIDRLSSKRVEKISIGEPMKEFFEEEALRTKMRSWIESGNIVYTFVYKKEMLGCYFISVDEKQHTMEEVYIVEKAKEGEEKLCEGLKEHYKEMIAFQEIESFIWGEEIIEQAKVSIGKGSKSKVGVGALFFCGGVLLWALTNQIIWLSIGLLFGVAYGTASTVSTVSKKKDAESSNENEDNT